MPLSRLLDLIAIHQIKAEGARYRKPMSDAEELDYILSLR
jgi:hypothetical protein